MPQPSESLARSSARGRKLTEARGSAIALCEAVPIGAQTGPKNKMLGDRPGVLRVGAGLSVGKPWVCRAGKRACRRRGTPGFRCAALIGKFVNPRAEAADVEAEGELMRAMPMTGGGDHVAESLQTAPTLMQALKIIAAAAVDKEHEGLCALRRRIENATIGGDTELEKRDEAAAPLGRDGGGLGIEGVEAKIGVVGTIVEEAGMKDVPRCEVVLQAKEIVAGPLRPV